MRYEMRLDEMRFDEILDEIEMILDEMRYEKR